MANTGKGQKAQLSRLRLLRAAERLFAEHGTEGVSLRQVASAAGHGNTNAVQYHFKSKSLLLDAIFTERLTEMEASRKKMLDVAGRDGLLDDPRTLLAILCLPHLELVDGNGRHPFAHFLHEYLVRYTEWNPIAGEIAATSSSALRQVVMLLDAKIAHVPEKLRSSRITLCLMMFVGMIARFELGQEEASQEGAFRRKVDDTLDIMAAALTAAYREREQTTG